MENRREYYRTFIILKQDTRGYSFSNKEPSGYCKVDAYGNKAKVQVYVQDLKPVAKEQCYKIYLLANLPTGSRQVPIKSFYVDEKGKRDVKLDINRNNVGESGLAIEQFEGVAIVVDDSSSNNLAPLTGFKREPFMWRNTKNNRPDPVEEKVKPEERKEVQKRTEREEAKEVEKVEEVEEVDDFLSYFTPDSYWDFPRNKPKKEDFLDKILNENAKMNPFERINEDIEWYRISYEELPLILNYPWRWYSNPYLLVGAKKYNHLLLGKNTQFHTYYLGVPDIYFPSAKERARVFGFDSFLCCKNTRPAPGEYGYWIMDLPPINIEK